MKKLMAIACAACLLGAGCLSITNNIGDSAIRAAAGNGSDTNALAESSATVPTTNGTVTVTSAARGGLVIINNANQPKHIAPVTDLKVPAGAY